VDIMTPRKRRKKSLFIVLLSIHGLVRGEDPELGRDADTGGQVKYVVELARALGEHPEVERAVLLTRRVVDPDVSPDYARMEEPLSDKAAIVRIECGEEGYIRKELLWDYLDSFSDNIIDFLRQQDRLPDIIHSHYADAGYVGSRLSNQLGVPLVHTGHSLGRSKRLRLLATGVTSLELEGTYNISRRIEAEETTLSVAERVITSTQQEVEEQYGLYDFYQPERMRVIPPGTDMSRFYPSKDNEWDTDIGREVRRFLKRRTKPVVLALSRPDPKKNIVTLIDAFGESPELREAANLVIVAGNRDDIHDMDDGPRGVLTDILLAVDRHDLYGSVAYPKHHRAEDVAILYRLAAATRGVFVNPALTEPFGLTLLEAAACGLPLVATEDGGPRDIIGNCRNGYLIDPLDKEAMSATILEAIRDRMSWRRFARNGIQGVRRHYSWKAHVEKYLEVLRPLVDRKEPLPRPCPNMLQGLARKQALFVELDLSLLGDEESLRRLTRTVYRLRKSVIFGITTGRRLDDALATLRKHRIPQPDVLISGQGTEIHYAPNLTQDTNWERHINHLWTPDQVRKALRDIPGLSLQPKKHLSHFKLSYYIDTNIVGEQEIRQTLQRADQAVNVFVSFEQYLDVLPVRASKGLALRWCAEHLDFPLENTMVAGVTGADADMLRGNTLGTVVDSRHIMELSGLVSVDNIYFAKASHAEGILEAMEHYGFPKEGEGA
jgi:sucrose-phosphate synthase